MHQGTGAKPKTYGISTRSNSRTGQVIQTQDDVPSGNTASVEANNRTVSSDVEDSPNPNKVTEDGSTITTPSFSPLTMLGNSGEQVERMNSTGIVEVVESALEATQASMLELMRKEMQKAVSIAVKTALSQTSSPHAGPSSNPAAQSVDWPHELPSMPTAPVHTNAPTVSNIPNDDFINVDNRNCFSRPKYPYISKWGVKFDGTTKTPQIEDFLFRVERLRKSYGFSERELLEGFHLLLEGRANQWYWAQTRQYPDMNWKNFKLNMTREFQRYQSNLDVLRQMMDRKQGRDETVTQYIDAITILRTQLRQSLQDYEVIDIIKAGLKPRIAHLLFSADIYSVEQLRNECRKAEEFLDRESVARVRTNAPSRMVNEIFDSDYKEITKEVDELKLRPKVTSFLKTETSRCWNCGDNGHVFKQCTSSQRSLFCFKCGSPGITAPQCNNCKKSTRPSNPFKSESVSTQTVD